MLHVLEVQLKNTSTSWHKAHQLGKQYHTAKKVLGWIDEVDRYKEARHCNNSNFNTYLWRGEAACGVWRQHLLVLIAKILKNSMRFFNVNDFFLNYGY